MPASLADTRAALIARYLERRRNISTADEDAISKRPDGACVEASEEQRRIWLHCVMADCAELYNEPFALQYTGILNIPAFERAFNEILRRHEAWRTKFEMRGDQVFQNVASQLYVPLPLLDLRKVPSKNREKRVAELLTEDSKLKFDLAEVPLFRARLVQVSDRDFRFLVVAHHLIADGVSVYQSLCPNFNPVMRLSPMIKSPRSHLCHFNIRIMQSGSVKRWLAATPETPWLLGTAAWGRTARPELAT